PDRFSSLARTPRSRSQYRPASQTHSRAWPRSASSTTAPKRSTVPTPTRPSTETACSSSLATSPRAVTTSRSPRNVTNAPTARRPTPSSSTTTARPGSRCVRPKPDHRANATPDERHQGARDGNAAPNARCSNTELPSDEVAAPTLLETRPVLAPVVLAGADSA